jgi:hypothetical protein
LFRRYRLAALYALCVLWGLASLTTPAIAHDLALSGIRIELRGTDTVVRVTTPISRLIRAEADGAAMTPVALDLAIRHRLHLRIDGKPLSVTNATIVGDNARDMVRWQTVVPGSATACEVTDRLYPEDAASRTLVTEIQNGKVFREVLLDAEHPTLQSNEAPVTAAAVALRFIREGIGHIFGGPDHILFVLGLLLLGGTLKALLRTVTAFTVAHSITLTLAATGVCNPSPRLVEPLIALSIVLIAVENLRHLQRKPSSSLPTPPRDLRPYYAFGFGLIHGFGFAGALAEVGLPRAALGVALASFNIGVEIGQVTIILAAAPALAWLARSRPTIFRRVVLAGSIVIGLAGAYWFFSRLSPA